MIIILLFFIIIQADDDDGGDDGLLLDDMAKGRNDLEKMMAGPVMPEGEEFRKMVEIPLSDDGLTYEQEESEEEEEDEEEETEEEDDDSEEDEETVAINQRLKVKNPKYPRTPWVSSADCMIQEVGESTGASIRGRGR